MSTDRDMELGSALRGLPTPEHDPGFWAELEERLSGEVVMEAAVVRPGRFRPRTWLLTAAAVLALTVAAVAVLDGGTGTTVRVGPPATTPDTEPWSKLSGSPLSGRSGAAEVWTGSRMVIWGGQDLDGLPLDDGASYEPAEDRWDRMAPSPTGPLSGPAAVWTGTRVLVWGATQGEGDVEASPTGALYDPATDAWTEVSPTPLRSVGQTVVWTGKTLLVWGGSIGESPVADGASYDPQTDAWTPLARAPIPARFDHTAVWTGDRMIVWGGFSGEESPSRDAFGDGAAYDPATDGWTTLPVAPISARAMHVAVWTGTSMVIWGGASNTAGLVTDGAVYDPAARAWTPMPASPLTPRTFPSALAARGSLLLWGGENEAGGAAGGAAFVVATGTWQSLPPGPLAARSRHSAVWTGSTMLVWGGADRTDLRADGAALRLPAAPAEATPATTPRT